MALEDVLQAPWDLMVLSMLGSGFLAIVLGLLHRLYQQLSWELLRQGKAALRGWLEDGEAKAPVLDEVEAAVEERMRLRKVGQFQAMLKCACPIFLAGDIFVMLTILSGSARFNTPAQDVCVLVSHLLVVLGALRPGIITYRSLDPFYTVLMLLSCGFLNPLTCTSTYLMPATLLVNPVVAMLNFVRRTESRQRLPLFALCNLLFGACASSCIWVNGLERFGELDAKRGALVQALITAMMAGVCGLLESGFRATLRQGLQLEEVRELHAAACALLRSFCECTVELDAEGVISGPSEELSSFLLKGTGGCCLQGARLSDLIVDAKDRATFEERLASPKLQKMGLAENLPLSMRDGCGNLLRLEVLWFEFRRLDQARRFMLGVREMEAKAQEGPNAEPDSFTSVPDTSVTSNEPEAAILVVDSLEEGMPIRGVTPAFAAEVGRLPLQVPLARYLQRPEDFTAWLQEAAITEHGGSCKVTLLLPWGQVKASCRVLLRSSGNSATDCLEELGLLFFRIRKEDGRRHGVRRGTPGGASLLTL